MKKLILIIVVLGALGGGYYYYRIRNATPEPTVMTQTVSRGDIVDTVGATGTLEAVETVDVGTQVSGVVQELHADFNTIVKKGQVIARLDPQLIQTQIEQQTANVVRAEADLERLKVSLADAVQKLDRAKQMSAKQLIPQTELETAQVNVKAAEAQIRSSEAGLTQARAQLNNQKVNLAYTTITAPIDGIVISRNVDQGQTVAASMNAPTLYVIAADLTKMQVLANIDEADVGRMRPGQVVTFRVDAFPTDTFTGVGVSGPPPAGGRAERRHLLHRDLGAEPGAEAEAGHDGERQHRDQQAHERAARAERGDAVPADAGDVHGPESAGAAGARARARRVRSWPWRWTARSGRPGRRWSARWWSARRVSRLPSRRQRPRPSRHNRRGRRLLSVAGRVPVPTLVVALRVVNRPLRIQAVRAKGGGRGESRGGFNPNMTPEEREERRKRMEERMASMSPEERERLQARMREGGGGRGGSGGREGGNGGARQGDGSGPGLNGNGGARGRQAGNTPAAGQQPQPRTMSSGATIDSLFGPLPVVESRGTVWQYENKQLKSVRLRLGVTDQTFTEVLNESDLPANAELVVTMTTGLEPRTQPGQNQQNNPLMGPQRGGPGGRGGQGGGGGGGGGRGRG